MNEEITQCDIRIAEIGAECILTEEIVKARLPDVYGRKHRLGGRGSRTGNIRFQHTSLSL